MKQLVIMPGGFHPFHAGHAALYQSAVEAFPGADVYVAATNDTSTRPFPFPVKEKLAQLAGISKGRFMRVKSPFRAEEITAPYDPDTTQLIFVRSEKDRGSQPRPGGNKKDGTSSYLQPYNDASDQSMSQQAYMAYLPTVEFGPGMTSATEIRGAWPQLNEKRKTALVMSLYPKTQTNPRLAATVVKLLDTAMGVVDESALDDLPRPNKRNQFKSLHRLRKQRGLDEQGMEKDLNEFSPRDDGGDEKSYLLQLAEDLSEALYGPNKNKQAIANVIGKIRAAGGDVKVTWNADRTFNVAMYHPVYFKQGYLIRLAGQGDQDMAENLKPDAFKTLQQAKQRIEQNHQQEVDQWAQDFRANSSKLAGQQLKQRFAEPPPEPPTMPVVQPGESPDALKNRLAQLNIAKQKFEEINALIKAIKKKYQHSAIEAEITAIERRLETGLLPDVRAGVADNYKSLLAKLDNLKTSLTTRFIVKEAPDYIEEGRKI